MNACDAVISITRSAPFGDFDHAQCVYFLQETTRRVGFDDFCHARRESMTFLIGKLRHFVVGQKGKEICGRQEISAESGGVNFQRPAQGIGGASGLVRSGHAGRGCGV